MGSEPFPAVVGREHWLEQNKRWRQGSVHPNGGMLQSSASQQGGKKGKGRKPTSSLLYNHVFRKLIIEKRPLKHPLPLTDAIPILVHGWKKTGVWPTDLPELEKS